MNACRIRTGDAGIMPNKAYDVGAGGYPNPLRPTDLLHKAQTGA